MSEIENEVLLPKMQRTKKRAPISYLNLLATGLCIMLLIFATFINLNIKHFIIPTDLFTNKNLSYENFVYTFCLVPQIPFVMFICSILGKKMATVSVILYILLGLTFVPIFALGGGITYIGQYGFGYILSFIAAVIVAGNFLNEKYSFLDMIKATLSGVLIIHLAGILYMIIIALIKHAGWDFISSWIIAQSGLKIIYDLIVSFILVMIGKYLHFGLKYITQ